MPDPVSARPGPGCLPRLDGAAPLCIAHPLGSFFFALFSLFRIHLHIGLINRPLFVGLIIAAFSANPTDILGTALVLELLWLDIFPAGTVIPPDRLLPLFLMALIAKIFHLHGAAEFFVPLCFFLVAAPVGSILSGWLRKRQNLAHARLQDWANRGESRDLPAILLFRSTILFLASYVLLFTALALPILFVTRFCLSHGYSIIAMPGVTWPWLILASGIGGVLALRLKTARFLFACVFAVLVVLLVVLT